jgi:hypothetical protein
MSIASSGGSPPAPGDVGGHVRRPTFCISYVQIGALAGAEAAVPAALLRSRRIRITGSGAGSASADTIMAELPGYTQMIAEGRVKVPVRVFPLSAVTDAWVAAAGGASESSWSRAEAGELPPTPGRRLPPGRSPGQAQGLVIAEHWCEQAAGATLTGAGEPRAAPHLFKSLGTGRGIATTLRMGIPPLQAALGRNDPCISVSGQ